jgi:hypothetical protein
MSLSPPANLRHESMTTLDLQRQNSTPDPTLASILRQSEKRHAVHERVDKSSAGQNGKPTESRAEELEWEFCLRRYFDYLDSHGISNSNTSHSSRSQRSDPGISRYSSHSSLSVCAPVRPHLPPPARSSFSYRSYRQGDESESHISSRQTRLLENSTSGEGQSYNEIYTRPRRNSTASTVSNKSTVSRTTSWTGSQPDSSASPVTDIPRRRSQSFGTGVQWEQLSFGPEISSHGGQHNSMGKAWNDIVAAMQTMSPNEARAYIQGRLAGLDPNATAHIRQSLNMDMALPTRSTSLPPQAVIEPQPVEQQVLPGRDAAVSRRAFAEPRTLVRAASAPVTMPRNQETKASKERILRESSGNIRPKISRRSSKKRASHLRVEHTRALSTIVERPYTAKSKASSTKSRKSIFSLKKTKPPPLPEFPTNPEALNPSYAASVKSTASSKLRNSINASQQESRIVELDESSEEEFPLKATNPRILKADQSKQLPMTPDQFETNPVKRMTRLFGFKKARKMKSTPLQSVSTPPPAMRTATSMETLHKASLDMRRNGSKSTICLVAIQEGPEQPFQVWLSALPYIEGETASLKV